MTATRNNLRAATAALSGAATILLAVILLAIRPIPAFAEGDQVVLDIPTEVPCVVKADGSVVAPSPEKWVINNKSGEPVILGEVTITPGTDAGPIGLSASATPYDGNGDRGKQFDWFSYGRGQDAYSPSAEQTLEAGNSLQVAWSIDKLDSVKNRKAIDGSTKAGGFALANIQFSYKKKEAEAFAVVYDDGENRKTAKLYKRYVSKMPNDGELFDDGTGGKYVVAVFSNIEEKKSLFADKQGITSELVSVTVVDDCIQPSTTSEWFKGCTNLRTAVLNKLDTSQVTNMDLMFNGCHSLETLNGPAGWNTENVDTMYGMFAECKALKKLDISKWSTPNVTTVKAMFFGCETLADLALPSKFVTSRVTNMESLFSECYALASLTDLTSWDTSQVTNMDLVFNGCHSLETLNGPAGWNTENVDTMYGMFAECKALKKLDISKWSAPNVTTVQAMFFECENLTELALSPTFVTSSVINMEGLFRRCYSLSALSGITDWDTSKVLDMGGAFAECKLIEKLDLSGWDTISANTAHSIFAECSSLKWVILKEKWKFPFTDCGLPATMYVKDDNGTYTGYTSPFPTTKTDTYYTEKPTLKSFAVVYRDENNQKTAKLYKRYIEKMPIEGELFDDGYGDGSKEVFAVYDNIENEPSLFYNKSNVTDELKTVTVVDSIQPSTTYCWFGACTKLSEIKNLNYLDTSSVQNMGSMFSGCSGLKSLDLSKFDTGNVTNMSGMFSVCRGLKSLDLSKFDTGKVTNMSGMFGSCSGLKSLDLSSFNTGKVTNMSSMFSECSGLESLDLSKFDTGKVKSMGGMFSGCKKLTTVSLPIDSNSSAKLQEALKKDGVILQSSQRTISEDASVLSAPDGMELRQFEEDAENRSFEPVGSESSSGSTASAVAIAPSSNVSSAGKAEADFPGQSGGSESKEPSAEKADNCRPDSDGNLSSDKSGSSAHAKQGGGSPESPGATAPARLCA